MTAARRRSRKLRRNSICPARPGTRRQRCLQHGLLELDEAEALLKELGKKPLSSVTSKGSTPQTKCSGASQGPASEAKDRQAAKQGKLAGQLPGMVDLQQHVLLVAEEAANKQQAAAARAKAPKRKVVYEEAQSEEENSTGSSEDQSDDGTPLAKRKSAAAAPTSKAGSKSDAKSSGKAAGSKAAIAEKPSGKDASGGNAKATSATVKADIRTDCEVLPICTTLLGWTGHHQAIAVIPNPGPLGRQGWGGAP
ncbi:hypothetical protein HaLaN_16586, partial [Haematococcus lacustris]